MLNRCRFPIVFICVITLGKYIINIKCVLSIELCNIETIYLQYLVHNPT